MGMHPARARILSPTGEQLKEIEFSIDLRTNMGNRTTGKINSLMYSGDGIYEFQVCVQENDSWTPVASIPLEIVHEQPEPEEISETND